MGIRKFRPRLERAIPWLGGLGLVIAGSILAGKFFEDRSVPRLRLSAGPKFTRRHDVAAYLCQQAERHEVAVELVDSAGSEECLQRIQSGELDVALVSNGIVVPHDDDIRVLAALPSELVHVLARRELADGRPLAQSLRGKRVNIGVRGSSEWLLARDFLAFARLKLPSGDAAGDVTPTEWSKEQLVERAQAILAAAGPQKQALIDELPDCLLVLASMPSTVVPLLAEAADYQIATMPMAPAYLLDNLQASEPTTTTVEREFLERGIIPANSYFTTRPFPASDCQTVGTKLLLVAHQDASERGVRGLMEAIFEGEFSRRIKPKSPRELATPYALHAAAVDYLDRDKPLAVQETMEWINGCLSVFGAFSAGALSLYGLLWRQKVRRPADYYAEIRKVELLAAGAESDPDAPLERQDFAKHLDDRLLQLRQELIEDICEGRIKGEPVIANILALLKDARRNLPHDGAVAEQLHALDDGRVVRFDANHAPQSRPSASLTRAGAASGKR